MLHKIVDQDKTGEKCNSLLIFCYACLMVIFFHQTRHAFRYEYTCSFTIGVKTITIGMLGTICGVEILMVRKSFSFFFQRTSITPA